MTRGEKVIAFIEQFCRVPEGKNVGKPLVLEPFQKEFILAIYNNPHKTKRALLSIARKNGKTALIAAILLCHIVGCEAVLNSQIVSGALSREQAAIVFKLAVKMINLNPDLQGLVKIVPSSKIIHGLKRNVEFRALSAEAGTAHGLSPILVILDEVGQIKGSYSAFVEALETAQGAYDNALLIAISTQAATDGDLFNIWLDDAEKSKDPQIVARNYTAPMDCALDDEAAWRLANPSLGTVRSIDEMRSFAESAKRMASSENSFRWLYLNQRVNSDSPFISKATWQSCGAEPEIEEGAKIWIGLDLSSVQDLTALVYISNVDSVWQVQGEYYLPRNGLIEKSQQDRVPYTEWEKMGHLVATHGNVVDYSFVAQRLKDLWQLYDVQKVAFDRWNFQAFKMALVEIGFTEDMLEKFVDFGQGFKSMSPALRELEVDFLNGNIAHGNQPVLSMAAANATIAQDPAGNRKLVKPKERHRRIDPMIALTMARGVVNLKDIEVLQPDYSDGVYFV